MQRARDAASSSRPATPPRCCTPTARPPRTTGTRARSARRTAAGRRADRREAGRRVAAPRPRGRGDRGLARVPRLAPRARRTSSGWPTCTARSARRCRTRASARPAIEHYQKGINLLKDGPPRLELVRLYEEAAWLYLHTGDNMLAIYASEKALRLAERLGETRAASRAHGIFGRVFGRIGDTEKARQNLERAVELARAPRNGNGSTASGPREDQSETILALLGARAATSRSPRPTSTPPRAAYEEALALAEQMGVLPAQVELHAVAGAAGRLPRRLGAGRALDRGERRAGRARGPRRASSASRYALRGLLRWREGEPRRVHRAVPPRPRAGRAGRLVGARLPGAVRAGDLAARLGRPGRRAGRARPGARRLRARRPDRPVDPGDGGARAWS